MNVKRFIELVLLCSGFTLVNSYTDALWLQIVAVLIMLMYTTHIYRKNDLLYILIKKGKEKKEETFSKSEAFHILLNPCYKSLLTVLLFQTPFLVYSTIIQVLTFCAGMAILVRELRRESSLAYTYYVEHHM